MHTGLHLVAAQYDRHLYLLQPMSATAAVTGKAATTVLAEANSSAHQCILTNVYLRSDQSRKTQCDQQQTLKAMKPAVTKQPSLVCKSTHSFLSRNENHCMQAAITNCWTRRRKCFANLAQAHGLKQNPAVCCLLVSLSFIVLHKRIPQLAHTISVQMLLKCCTRHVRLTRQHMQNPVNGQWSGKHVYLPHTCLQSIYEQSTGTHVLQH